MERFPRAMLFWSTAMAGERPSIESTSGFWSPPRNWRAYAESVSRNRRCPSRKSVSKASEDLPEPETPVIATSAPRGRLTSTERRLFWRAPRIPISPASDPTVGDALERDGIRFVPFLRALDREVEVIGGGQTGPRTAPGDFRPETKKPIRRTSRAGRAPAAAAPAKCRRAAQ